MAERHLHLTITAQGVHFASLLVSEIDLAEGLLLGRGAPLVNLPDGTVSQRQAQVRLENGSLRLTHLGRKNPTRVLANDAGERLALFTGNESVRLGNRFTLLLGPYQIEGQFDALADTVTEDGADSHGSSWGAQDPIVVHRSEVMSTMLARARRAARGERSILLLGETGSGKDVIARLVHAESERRDRPFVATNVATIPSDGNLAELELFGRVPNYPNRGDGGHAGLFEQAHGGTLFLDEIGDLPQRLQPMLLRVVEEKRVNRMGADRTKHERGKYWEIPTDVRLVLATHQNLERKVQDHSFREDLFYRFSEVVLRVPPLRERPEDVDVLLEHFIAKERPGKARLPLVVSPPALAALRAYSWPGNVRQLLTVVRQLYTVVPDERATVSPEDVEHVLSHRLGSAGGRATGGAGAIRE